MERVFLGWRQPALVAAAEQIPARMSPRVPGIVAVPGARAGRRLREILSGAGAGPGGTVRPKIVTLGQLPEFLYVPSLPIADALTQRLAWSQALQRVSSGSQKELLPNLPVADLTARLSMAETLARLHRELSGEGLDFSSVAQRRDALDGFREVGRWRALAEVEKEYLQILDEIQRVDLHRARLLAARQGAVRTEGPLVLVGVVEMNRALQQMLDQVADRTTALVFAPSALSERFDQYGCVRPEAWQNVPLGLKEADIEVVGGPTEQATVAAKAITQWIGSERVTVGVPDRQVTPYLEQRLRQAGLQIHDAAGLPAARTEVCRLLADVVEYLDGQSFQALAALVRHPALQDWLERQSPDATSIGAKMDAGGPNLPSPGPTQAEPPRSGVPSADWLTELDDYASDHLPQTLPLDGLPPHRYPGLGFVMDHLRRLLGPLIGPARPLTDWGEPVGGLLTEVYPLPTVSLENGEGIEGSTDCDWQAAPLAYVGEGDDDGILEQALSLVRTVLDGYAATSPLLAPTVSGSEALRLLLRQLGGEMISPRTADGAIEVLGWLELPLDDKPVLVLTGVNEGTIPSSVGADPFLPPPLRRALALDDNARRNARDAYWLATLAGSRKALRVIAGRRSAEGDPLLPSRLLFACDASTGARRVLRFFADRAGGAEAMPAATPPGRSTLDVSRPLPLPEPVESLRVTEFRDYLACPYRYYLRHRLSLQSRSDHNSELDDAAFGNLTHSVLAEFGRGALAGSADSEKIRDALDDALDRLAANRYGKTPLPAVRVQIEQLRFRLGAFARWQAAWVRQGWRIEHVEVSPREDAALVVDGRPMRLRGRIDRIDVHRSGKRVLLDYKTSDTAHTPERTHRRDGRWIDLQLPLYRQLVARMGIEGRLDLGYVVLPKDTGRVGALLASWTEDELLEADAVGAEVVRKVRQEVFWPPASPAPACFPEFAAICQDDQFAVALHAEEA